MYISTVSMSPKERETVVGMLPLLPGGPAARSPVRKWSLLLLSMPAKTLRSFTF